MKRRRNRVGHFYCRTWKMNFYYFIGWDAQDFTKWMNTAFKTEIHMERNVAGKCYRATKPDSGRVLICIWTREKRGLDFYATLCHEAVHAANFALEHAGVEVHYGNDEPLAYLTDTIFREALRKV